MILKKIAFGLLALFLFTACETGYKGDYPDSNSTSDGNKSPDYSFNYTDNSFEPQVFEGGYLSDGLDLFRIRESQQDNKLRLVFDSKGSSTNKVGSYSFIYYPDKYLITAIIGGYRKFSAKLPHFSSSSIVEKIYMDEYLDDSGYKFNIKLRDDANVKVFNLENPARIVVDISSI